MTRRARLALATLGLGAAAALATTAAAQPAETEATAVLPGPNQFVSGLDLECYATQGPALNIGLTLTHLNPVLRQLGLPAHDVVIRELAQTCVPVTKNGKQPQPAALPFIQQVDLACYRIDASPLATPVSLSLGHLNPVLTGFPAHKVTLTAPAQLCLPVGKNGVALPPDVLRLAQYIDLECYTVTPDPHPTFGVTIDQLNPQLVGKIAAHPLTLVSSPRQLCVPVQKNQQQIPTDVLGVLQWVDLEKFTASPVVNVAPVSVSLNHLNPLFVTQPKVAVVLQKAVSLLVPVSKNGAVPPLP